MNEMPQDVLGFKPDIEDAWTIDQHLRHVLTIEIKNFLFVNDGIANHITKEFTDRDTMGDFEELLSHCLIKR